MVRLRLAWSGPFSLTGKEPDPFILVLTVKKVHAVAARSRGERWRQGSRQ